ncbi:efflux RND transporter periplasmic adaptor subunit [Orrella marina]|uniref:Efflux transporter periplasmic adaptor subunit n=1 Tax=Orrella marina TaxID=2163011 RepID=A0A2R4XP14_9BURK|nr:efflux RND transporter periplasmic adaptor subunit [Orrella marina]AWB35508.1 efflux transporter periplasmic adaptor subunit [Orrella marina]
MKTSNRILASVVLLGAGLAAGYYSPVWLPMIGLSGPAATSGVAASSPAPAAPARAAPAVPVEIAVVEEVSFPRGLSAIGNLRSAESIVISAEISGRIAKINFEEGQPVSQGDVLVELDDSVPRAELAQAEANLALAQSRFDRSQRLQTAGFVSKEAREDASIALQLQQAAIELAKARLDKTRIVAPFDGVVGLRKVSIGEYLSPGQDIAPLESIEVLKADFRLPERYVSDIQVGQTLEINVDALPQRQFLGEVYAVSPLVEAGGRSVMVRANVDNQDGLLFPGMFARVQLITQAGDAIVVPETALSPSGQRQFVYRVTDSIAEQVPVEIGERRGGLVEIVAGLQAGDQVTVSGLQRIRDGATVNILGEPRTASQVATDAAEKAASVGGTAS